MHRFQHRRRRLVANKISTSRRGRMLNSAPANASRLWGGMGTPPSGGRLFISRSLPPVGGVPAMFGTPRLRGSSTALQFVCFLFPTAFSRFLPPEGDVPGTCRAVWFTRVTPGGTPDSTAGRMPATTERPRSATTDGLTSRRAAINFPPFSWRIRLSARTWPSQG